MAASREAFSSSSLVPEGGLWVGAMRVGFLAVRWRLPVPVGLPLARSAAHSGDDSLTAGQAGSMSACKSLSYTELQCRLLCLRTDSGDGQAQASFKQIHPVTAGMPAACLISRMSRFCPHQVPAAKSLFTAVTSRLAIQI